MTDLEKGSNLVSTPASARSLTSPEFQQLAQVPPATDWFAKIDNPNTRRAYRNDVQEFMGFAGISAPADFRLVSPAHVLAWRKDLERRALAVNTLRRKLAALSSLFEYLYEQNAVSANPVDRAKRPKVESNEGKTLALGDAQTRQLLKQPARSSRHRRRQRAGQGSGHCERAGMARTCGYLYDS